MHSPITPRLAVRGLNRPGLAPVHLHVNKGQCVAISGPSGAGKTLLLRAIADLDPNVGSITLDGTAREAFGGPAWRRRVAYAAAESGWWADIVGEHFPVGDNGEALIVAVGLAADALNWPVARLSTGERQRLALARTLAMRPAVLLLDEPTSALDHVAVKRVEGVLQAELARGTAILVVSHDPDQVARLAHLHLTMADGRLITPGEPAFQGEATS